MLVMDFEEYAALNGASFAGYGDAGLHRSSHNVSDAHKKRMLDRQAQRDAELFDLRGKLQKEYEQKVLNGEIRPPNRIERLQRAASGHPDNPATQAAKRLLEKVNRSATP